ncbi:MAG: SDR family NAD(P)-dependent oxidoreductase, partial [Elusimicrobiota bacterium]
MDLGLKDKVAWVAGASRGIGLAIARGLAAEGCRVALTARSTGPLAESVACLGKEFGTDRIAAYAADLSVDNQYAAAVVAIQKRWGRLDITAINVGTGSIPGGSLPTDADWDLALSQNLRAPICAVRHAAPALKRQGGAIVIVGSI